MKPTQVFEALRDELKTCEIQLWKSAQEVAIRLHLERGEILRRYEKDSDIEISKLVKAAAVGRSESSLWNSLKIWDEHTLGLPTPTVEVALEKVYDKHGESASTRKLLNTPAPKVEETHQHDYKCKCGARP